MTFKFWRVARHEYSRHVVRKRFVLVVLSVPGIIAFAIGMIALSIALTKNNRAVGYVDKAGLLANPLPSPQRGSSPDNPVVPELIPLVPFETEEAARSALESDEIQAYYVVLPDYLETNHVELVYIKPPSGDATRQFWDFMQINRLRDLPPDVASRATAGYNLVVRWPADATGGGREFSQRTFLMTFFPFIAAIMFVFLLLTASGYFMSVVGEERENRTIEVVLTSTSAGHLIGGKVLGILAITLTQCGAWIACGGAAVLIGSRILDISLLQNLTVDMRFVWLMGAIITPAFVMVAALMTAVGAIVAEPQEGSQVVFPLMLPLMAPIWFAWLIMENPNSPLAIGLSLFPPTSVATFSLRLGFSQVPGWQIAASVALTTLCAIGSLWLAGRVLRLGMLRYGRRLRWEEVFKQLFNRER